MIGYVCSTEVVYRRQQGQQRRQMMMTREVVGSEPEAGIPFLYLVFSDTNTKMHRKTKAESQSLQQPVTRMQRLECTDDRLTFQCDD